MAEHGLVSAAEKDGILYLLGNNKPRKVRDSKLHAQAELVVDFANGVILKNCRGPLTPLDSKIGDRLLLARSRAFEFDGFVDGCGFAVRVDFDLTDGEFWGIIRHWGDLLDREFKAGVGARVLVEKQHGTGDWGWGPWNLARHEARFDDLDENLWRVATFEHERDAIVLALDLCDGLVKPAELDEKEE